MILLNLIHNTPLVNHEKVDYVNYIEESDPSKLRALLKPVPILFVGYKFVKTIYPNHNDVFEKKLGTGVYWEYAYEENRSAHIEGIFNVVFKQIFEVRYPNFKYETVDPIFNNIRNERDVISQIEPIEYSYIANNMIYVSSNNRSKVFGIDLNAYNFFGFDSEFIVNQITTRTTHVIDNEGDVFIELKTKFPHVTNLKRYIPFLLQSRSK
jgi:hypothetical protein